MALFWGSIVVFLCLMASSPCSVSSTTSIDWRITYRDFLPAGCFYTPEFQRIGKVNLGGNFGDLTGLNLSDPLIRELNEAWETDVYTINNLECCTGNARAMQCVDMKEPWVTMLKNGEISGHPDFNAQGFFTTYNEALCNSDFPVGSCLDTQPRDVSIINTTLVVNHAGIPKPAYCLDGEDSRCGFHYRNSNPATASRWGTSRKKYFDSWYNDDKKYNKRIGQILRLYSNDDVLFTYDSNLGTNATQSNEQPQFMNTDQNTLFFGPLDRFGDSSSPFFLNESDYPNPFDAPAWPTYNRFYNSGDKTRTYSVSTEMHETFQFRNDTDMIFEFSGDDDFWAFINGQMIIDLGGLHGIVDATVDLNEEADGVLISERLGLVHEGVYTVDIFHAERNYRGSNFRVQTSLAAACNVIQSGTLAIDSLEVAQENLIEFAYKKTQNVIVNEVNGEVSLTQSNDFNRPAFLFTQLKQNIGRGFISKFTVSVDGNTDGFAFVAQDFGLVNYPLSGSPFFNFKGLQYSFAIVFDLCKTVETECDTQEVRIHYNNISGEGNFPFDATRTVYDSIVRNLKTGNEIEIEIIYYGGNPDFLEVYIDNSLYLREDNFPIQDILGSLSGHVGFTATTSDKAANINISNWSLKTVEVDPTKTQFEQTTNVTAGNMTSNYTNASSFVNEVVSDGISLSPGITIRTFDGCNNPLDSGTLEGFIDAVYVEKLGENNTYSNGSLIPKIVEPFILDNRDGSYAVQFATNVEASYELWLVFGEGCALNFSVPENATSLYVFNATLAREDDALCFFSVDREAGESLPFFPPTPAPTELPPGFDDDDVPIVPIAAASGTFMALALVAAAFMLYFRREWLRKKGFIPDGKTYLLDVNTTFDDNTPYSVTAGEVMRTQAEINRRRAEAAGADGSKEIAELQDEIDERKEVIRMQKKKMGIDMPTAARMETSNPRYKTEF